MENKTFFIAGDKSFELIDTGEGWFILIERGRRFSAKIRLDEVNLRRVCGAFRQASRVAGNHYRRWGWKSQTYAYRVFQNFNTYGRFIRIETWTGDRKKAIIVPESVYNGGWGDIANKILHFLEVLPTNRHKQASAPQSSSYVDTAKISQWPEISATMAGNITTETGAADLNHQFLSRCLVGVFNDPFNYSPNQEVIQKWFLNRWKICALRVTPFSHNQFLFEFPSRQEAARIHAGEWFWNGRRLSLEWWSPVAGTDLGSQRSEYKWVKAFGIPIHAWSLETFKTIGDLCGGFVGIDEDTKHRNHYSWARICVNTSRNKCPDKIELDVVDWRFEISILKEVAATPKPIPSRGQLQGRNAGEAGEKKLGNISGSVAEEKVPPYHVGEQVAEDNFNSKFSGPTPSYLDYRAGKKYLLTRPSQASCSGVKSPSFLGPIETQSYYFRAPNLKAHTKGKSKKAHYVWRVKDQCPQIHINSSPNITAALPTKNSQKTHIHGARAESSSHATINDSEDDIER